PEPSPCPAECVLRGPGALRLGSELLPPHEPQARPGLVDGTNLVVDEPERKRYLTDDVLRHVRRDLRAPLGPGDPAEAVREHGAAELFDPVRELRPVGREEEHDVGRRKSPADPNSRRKRLEELCRMAGIADDGEP